MFMSPSCVCDATTHPPAHTGMNAQSPHSFQGLSRSNRSRALFAPGVAPVVDVAGGQRFLAGEPGARVERAVGADRVGVLHVHVARAVVHAVGRREPVALAFPRAGTTSCRRAKSQRVAGRRRRPSPADRHAGAVERLDASVAPTGVSGRMPFGGSAAARRASRSGRSA